ncbi:MAG: TraR/DksA C4-type zinc finger protein [Flavobacteriales bacterium]|nr:TraR/DksA C4-type zinc finger protein [Flavobacteriales bacterium]
MDQDSIDKIKNKLSKEVAETKLKISKYKELSKPIPPENSIGRVSRMDAINNKSVVEAALREAENKLKQLEIINKKIGDSDFGICNSCKGKIPFGRLIIRPHSQLCVKCAK